MNKWLLINFVLMAMVCTVTGSSTFCQEEEAVVGYAEGTVVSISSDTITVSETKYNENTDEKVTENVVYKISPEIEVENVASVQEIKAEQVVDVEYVEKEGKKEATYIYVYIGEE